MQCKAPRERSAWGILLALLDREKTGLGCNASISLFDTGVASLANQATNWLNLQSIPQRLGSRHPNISPYGDTFFTADKKALIVSTGTTRQWEELCHLLELSSLITDDRFKSNTLRLKFRDQLADCLAKGFSRFKAAQLLKMCRERQVPIAPIRDMQEVFATPAAQDLVLEEVADDGTLSKRVKTAVFKIRR